MQVLCSIIAGLLHFSLLSVFCWLCLEGVELYLLQREVFEGRNSRRKYFYLCGYSIPGLVVAVSAAIDFRGYGSKTAWVHLFMSTCRLWHWLGTEVIYLCVFVMCVFCVLTQLLAANRQLLYFKLSRSGSCHHNGEFSASDTVFFFPLRYETKLCWLILSLCTLHLSFLTPVEPGCLGDDLT